MDASLDIPLPAGCLVVPWEIRPLCRCLLHPGKGTLQTSSVLWKRTVEHIYSDIIAADAGLEMSDYMAGVKEIFLDFEIIFLSTLWF